MTSNFAYRNLGLGFDGFHAVTRNKTEYVVFIITFRKKSHTTKSGKCTYDIKCIT